MPKLYRLETDRLLLRRPMKKDIPAMVKWLSNPNISNNTLTIPHPYFKSDAEHWLQKVWKGWEDKTDYVFGITLLKNQEYIGAMGLHANAEHNRAEVGYWIGEPYWNKGYATEALKAVLEFGFDVLEYHKIYATHMVHNASSGKVMAKAGMIREGKLVDHYKKGDRYVTVVQYRLIRDK